MIRPHRNKALIGLAGWLLPFAGLLLLAALRDYFRVMDWFSEQAVIALVWSGLVFEMVCFFWTGYHLAKGKGHSTALVGFGLLPCLQPVILTVLLVLPDKNPTDRQLRKMRSTSVPAESITGRLVRYRRNALIGNVFGLFFVFLGISTIYFPVGIFADFEDEALFGFLIFVWGYVVVIWGCRWWLKVKGWPDALIFIGLSPLTICLIPFVRNIFFIEPDLLPFSMFLMTSILLVVVFTLPDRSSRASRHRTKQQGWPRQANSTNTRNKTVIISNTATILPASEEDLPALAELAGTIWRQHYPGIISPAQIDYMLSKMYSFETLRTELHEKGIHFVRLIVGERFIGFASYGPQPEPGVMKLHKCYLLPELHGRGYGSLLLQYCEQEVRKLGARHLILAVNKQNTKAVTAYQRNGFTVAESVITDFGNGFVMDDYIMRKDLNAAPPV